MCPYFKGVLISEVSLFQMCPYFKGVLISRVSLFQGCPYFRGVFISDVSLFQGCPYFRGVFISGVFFSPVLSMIAFKYFVNSQKTCNSLLLKRTKITQPVVSTF